MPPLRQLGPNRVTGATRVWLPVLRRCLLVTVGMVVSRVVQLALGCGDAPAGTALHAWPFKPAGPGP